LSIIDIKPGTNAETMAAHWYCDPDRQVQELDATLEKLCLRTVRFADYDEQIPPPFHIYREDDTEEQE
jgi:hypothetical protein